MEYLAELPAETKTLAGMVAVLALLALYYRSARLVGPYAGLTPAYLTLFFMLHVLAPVVRLVPGQDLMSAEQTEAGLEVVLVALAGFGAGQVFCRFALTPALVSAASRAPKPLPPGLVRTNLWLAFWASGILFFAFRFVVPGLTPVVVSGILLLVPLSISGLQDHLRARQLVPFLRSALPLALVPAFTVLGLAFLGYAAILIVVAATGAAEAIRRKWILAVFSPVVLVVTLSVFVSYMSVRTTLREAVWGGASMAARLEALAPALGELTVFDPAERKHREAVDLRLNQNWLIGASREYIEGGTGSFARGGTLTNAVMALVPRVLWPGKPAVGGSGSIVSDYTGIRFAEGTSVGVGQVLEAYINFGPLGVFVTFLAIGGTLVVLDCRAGRSFAAKDLISASKWYLPGIMIVNMGGSFAETTVSIAGAGIMMWIVERYTTGVAASRRLAMARAEAT